jgi:hypothetical protein
MHYCIVSFNILDQANFNRLKRYFGKLKTSSRIFLDLSKLVEDEHKLEFWTKVFAKMNAESGHSFALLSIAGDN